MFNADATTEQWFTNYDSTLRSWVKQISRSFRLTENFRLYHLLFNNRLFVMYCSTSKTMMFMTIATWCIHMGMSTDAIKSFCRPLKWLCAKNGTYVAMRLPFSHEYRVTNVRHTQFHLFIDQWILNVLCWQFELYANEPKCCRIP